MRLFSLVQLKAKYCGNHISHSFELNKTLCRHKSSPTPTAAEAEREIKQNCINLHPK